MKWIRGPLLLSDLELGASLWRCLLRSLWGAYRHQLSVVRLHHGGMQVPLANCFVLLSVAALTLCFLLVSAIAHISCDGLQMEVSCC